MCLLSILPVFAAELVATAPEVLLTKVGFSVTVDGLAADSPIELRINDAVVSRSDGSGISGIDLEVGATGMAQLDVIHELQLSCYSYLFRKATGRTESGLEIRSLIKTKTPKVNVEHYGPRQATHFERLFSVIRAYLDAVSSNRYHISPGLGCSFCEYREAVGRR